MTNFYCENPVFSLREGDLRSSSAAATKVVGVSLGDSPPASVNFWTYFTLDAFISQLLDLLTEFDGWGCCKQPQRSCDVP